MPKQSQIITDTNVSPITVHEGSTYQDSYRLDNMILSATDETLKFIFKEAGAKAIYNYLEKKCQLKREEIAQNPRTFSTGLKMLLSSAAPMVENLILKDLHHKLHLKFEEKKGYTFSDCIKELRR
jgi:hypothetical protein